MIQAHIILLKSLPSEWKENLRDKYLFPKYLLQIDWYNTFIL